MECIFQVPYIYPEDMHEEAYPIMVVNPAITVMNTGILTLSGTIFRINEITIFEPNRTKSGRNSHTNPVFRHSCNGKSGASTKYQF